MKVCPRGVSGVEVSHWAGHSLPRLLDPPRDGGMMLRHRVSAEACGAAKLHPDTLSCLGQA